MILTTIWFPYGLSNNLNINEFECDKRLTAKSLGINIISPEHAIQK